MDISAIIYSAVGGGGGALLGSLLSMFVLKFSDSTAEDSKAIASASRSALAVIFGAIGVFVLGSLYKNMTLPRIAPLDDSEFIAATPIYAVIKEQSPAEYQQILKPADRAERNGTVTQADLNEMRAVYFELVAEKMLTASGSSLRAINKVSQNQHEIFREKSPRICTLFLNGEPFPALEDYFSPTEMKAEQDAMVLLFTAPPRRPNSAPDLEKGKVLFESALLTPMQELGIKDIRPDVSETAGNESDHSKICDLAIAYSKNKQALDDDDIIDLTAYLESL